MTAYYRPLIEERGQFLLAVGWCRFSQIEVLQRGTKPRICRAADIPEEAFQRLIDPRPDLGTDGMSRPQVMGVLNATPDSFSDGGQFDRLAAAMAHAQTMRRDGADIVDIGGESTRPGADYVDVADEIARTVPAVAELRQEIALPLSIDTRKASVAEAAVAAGADWINDVSALSFDEDMASLAARSGAPICLMHAPSDPKTMQKHATYEDVLLDRCDEGIARLAINRPTKRNAFRPRTVSELCDAFARIRDDSRIGVVLLTGVGPAADGGYAFCSGGDQSVRGDGGYLDETGLPRLNVLDLQRIIRSLPKVVIALVAGYAIGGGQVLHLLCDLSLAAENAVFGQTGPRVGSFDGGFGAGYLARVVGQRKAKEIWFLCRQYGADEALGMGLVNAVVPLEALEAEGVRWAREVLQHSPTAIRCLKAAFNAETDGLAGIQELAGQATHLFYRTEEGQEGRNAFLEKRNPDFSDTPWLP